MDVSFLFLSKCYKSVLMSSREVASEFNLRNPEIDLFDHSTTELFLLYQCTEALVVSPHYYQAINIHTHGINIICM